MRRVLGAVALANCLETHKSLKRSTAEEANTMKFRPLHDRVVIRRVEEATKTAAGIIIPDTAKEKPMQGE